MTIVMDQGFNVSVLYHRADTSDLGLQFINSKEISAGEEMVVGGEMGTEELDQSMMGASVKDPLLSNWFFVIGVSVASLVIGGIIGILLAKKKIKKGIELYED